MTTTTITVPEIHCGHCKESLEEAVGTLSGVASTQVSIHERTVAVEYDESVPSFIDIVAAIEDQGYEVPGVTR